MKTLRTFFMLFGSVGTLICCALPALLVSLGAGAALGSFLTKFPQLIWFSKNKDLVFAFGGLMIALGAYSMWKSNREDSCPIDPVLAEACKKGKHYSKVMMVVSALIYATGFTFAYLL